METFYEPKLAVAREAGLLFQEYVPRASTDEFQRLGTG